MTANSKAQSLLTAAARDTPASSVFPKWPQNTMLMILIMKTISWEMTWKPRTNTLPCFCFFFAHKNVSINIWKKEEKKEETQVVKQTSNPTKGLKQCVSGFSRAHLTKTYSLWPWDYFVTFTPIYHKPCGFIVVWIEVVCLIYMSFLHWLACVSNTATILASGL